MVNILVWKVIDNKLTNLPYLPMQEKIKWKVKW